MDDVLVLDNYSIHHALGAFWELLIYLSNAFKVAKTISVDLVGLWGVRKTCIFFYQTIEYREQQYRTVIDIEQ